MRGRFKTLTTKDKKHFVAVHGAEVYLSDNPCIFLANTATMERVAEIFPKEIIDRISIVDVEYHVKQN